MTYQSDLNEQLEWPYYSPPDKFEHGYYYKVAHLEGTDRGREVIVYEARMPERFFIVEVPLELSCQGVLLPGYSINTGSGVSLSMVLTLAMEISMGTITYNSEEGSHAQEVFELILHGGYIRDDKISRRLKDVIKRWIGERDESESDAVHTSGGSDN